jgi:uncharacterized repeat protein (TIGR02543 family)
MGQGTLTRAKGDLWNNGVVQWSVYADWSYNSDSYGCTYTCSGIYISSNYLTARNSAMNWSITMAGQTWSGTNSAPGVTRGSTVKIAGDWSKWVPRTQSSQTFTLSVWANVPSYSAYAGGVTGTATASALGPLASHTVTFNANGGSGAPGNQTKWYGTILTLSSTVPTRQNYEFLGWGTSSTATTVSYSAGAQYGDDADITLYAVWKLKYIQPSFILASAFRVASPDSTVQIDTGGYARAAFSWQVDTTVYSDNTLKDISIVYYEDDSTTPVSCTLSGDTSGTSGSVYTSFTASTASTYRVVCSVTDIYTEQMSMTATTIERSVGIGVIPFEIANKGHGVGILAAAPDSGIRLGSLTLTDVNTPTATSVTMESVISWYNVETYTLATNAVLYKIGRIVLVSLQRYTLTKAWANTAVTELRIPVGWRPNVSEIDAQITHMENCCRLAFRSSGVAQFYCTSAMSQLNIGASIWLQAMWLTA